MVSLKEYENFQKGFKLSRYRKKIYRNDFKTYNEYLFHAMDDLKEDEKMIGLNMIWILKKRGKLFYQSKMELLSYGQFIQTCEELGLDRRHVSAWVVIWILCCVYPEINRISNMSQAFLQGMLLPF